MVAVASETPINGLTSLAEARFLLLSDPSLLSPTFQLSRTICSTQHSFTFLLTSPLHKIATYCTADMPDDFSISIDGTHPDHKAIRDAVEDPSRPLHESPIATQEPIFFLFRDNDRRHDQWQRTGSHSGYREIKAPELTEHCNRLFSDTPQWHVTHLKDFTAGHNFGLHAHPTEGPFTLLLLSGPGETLPFECLPGGKCPHHPNSPLHHYAASNDNCVYYQHEYWDSASNQPHVRHAHEWVHIDEEYQMATWNVLRDTLKDTRKFTEAKLLLLETLLRAREATFWWYSSFIRAPLPRSLVAGGRGVLRDVKESFITHLVLLVGVKLLDQWTTSLEPTQAPPQTRVR